MPLNIADIYAHAPGSRFLASCPSKAQEDMLDYIYASMPATFKARTALNSSSVTSMDIAPDETPNRFSDLLGLCTKLVSAAGKRSHFEGLLIINISALLRNRGVFRLFSPAHDLGKTEIFKQEHAGQRPGSSDALLLAIFGFLQLYTATAHNSIP